MPGKWSHSRQLSSTQSVQPDLQLNRYLVTAGSMMLAVVLVVGAAGYAGISGLWSSSARTAKAARFEQANRDADPPTRIARPADRFRATAYDE
jgi:hypothetical protein